MCAVLSFLYGGRKPSSSKRSFVISLVRCVSEKQRTSKSKKLSLIKSNLCLMLRVLRCAYVKKTINFDAIVLGIVSGKVGQRKTVIVQAGYNDKHGYCWV